jgi:hypothetical protein
MSVLDNNGKNLEVLKIKYLHLLTDLLLEIMDENTDTQEDFFEKNDISYEDSKALLALKLKVVEDKEEPERGLFKLP